MDLPPDGLEAFFPFPEGGALGLEFSIDLGGRPLDIGELAKSVGRIKESRSFIVAAAHFGKWRDDESFLSGAAAMSCQELQRALSGRSRRRAHSELRQLARDLGLFNALTEDHPLGLQFNFAGAFRDNPTSLRFVARGTMYSMVLAVAILGAVQIERQWGAGSCRANAEQIANRQFAMLEKLARMEGRWTAQHAASHQATVEVVNVASQACNSVLDGFGFQLRVHPGIEYEIRLGPSSRATSPDPNPSPVSGGHSAEGSGSTPTR